MHDPHDDLLGQELSRLSEYTGETPTTPLWEQAVDAHRREQQQRLWVWVRRPAPALAAAGLALLVASISLRPIGTATDLSVAAAKSKVAERDSEVKLASGVDLRASGLVDGNTLPREITQNSPGLENFNARFIERKNDQAGGNSNGNELASAPVAGGGSGGLDVASRDRFGVSAGPDGNDSRGAYGGGVNKAGGAKPAAPADFDTARLATKTAPVADTPDVKAEVGYRDLASGTTAIPEPSANLALAVPDVGSFYKYVPSLVNEKLGEQILEQRAAAAGAGGAGGNNDPQALNLTLRVNEDRLPDVLSELKKYGRVQSQSGQQLAKETRLNQIDALVDVERKIALNQDVPSKEKGDKDASNHQGADRRKQAEGTIEALNRRRLQIEQGGELATINIVAVPEVLTPVVAAPAGDLLAGAAGKTVDGAPPPSAPTLSPEPTPANNTARSTGDLATGVQRDGRATTTGTPSVAGVDARRETPMDERKDLKELAIKLNQPAPSGSVPNIPLPGAVNAPSLQPSTPHSPPPATSAAPAAAAQPVLPGGAAERSVESGKLSKAARDGWSSLGDTTATFIRNAIGTMLYWLPLLIVAVTAIWWWRRRAVAAAKEPPPR